MEKLRSVIQSQRQKLDLLQGQLSDKEAKILSLEAASDKSG